MMMNGQSRLPYGAHSGVSINGVSISFQPNAVGIAHCTKGEGLDDACQHQSHLCVLSQEGMAFVGVPLIKVQVQRQDMSSEFA